MTRRMDTPATRATRWLGALALALALGAGACGGNLPPLESDMGDGGAGDMGLLPFCSLHCTMATAAQDCPVPPTSGQCNLQGYCKP
jgi:hypothetical protein